VQTAHLQKSGYLKSFPQHAQFATPLRFHPDSLSIGNTVDFTAAKQRAAMVDHLAIPERMLAPTICHHCFAARHDRTVDAPEIITATGLCHRFEGGNLTTLERLSTFRMRELVFLGSPEHVQHGLAQSLDWFSDLLTDCGVTHRIVAATDPFFGTGASSKRYFQAAAGSKKELCLFIPSSGRWISVASINDHGAAMAQSFGITAPAQATLRTGCIGFGLERLAYGLACALGCDTKAWPGQLGCRGGGEDRFVAERMESTWAV
jgi:seryl-tRNA synthetase